eukprot:gene13662-19550_t
MLPCETLWQHFAEDNMQQRTCQRELRSGLPHRAFKQASFRPAVIKARVPVAASMVDDAHVKLANELADAAASVTTLKAFDVETKADASPVTIADKQAETLMRKLIEETFPEHSIFGEEHGLKQGASPYMWVLDPIDGTRSFITGATETSFNRVRDAVKIPMYGCDCYAYGLLAAGLCDLVVEADLKPYDYMALVPVIKGAGGKITDWKGEELMWDPKVSKEGNWPGEVCAAGDPGVHAKALELLAWK